MPGRSGSDPHRLGQRHELGEPGDQPVDQGPGAVAGTGVDHQAGRLVHHDQLGVLVDDLEDHRRVPLRARPSGAPQRRSTPSPGRTAGRCCGSGRRPRRPAPDPPRSGRRPRSGRGRPPGPPPCPPAPRRATHGTSTVTDAHVGSADPRSSDDQQQQASDDDGGVGHIEGGPEVQGDEVDHRPVVVAEEPVAEIAQRPAEDEPEHGGPAGRRGTPDHVTSTATSTTATGDHHEGLRPGRG